MGFLTYSVDLAGEEHTSYDERGRVEWVVKRIPDPREYVPEIPEDLSKICMKALTRDLSDRYQHAGEMGFDLERYMYHDRFGPTNVTLSKYLRGLFKISDETGQDWSPDQKNDDQVVQRRADTIYRELM